MDSCEITAYVTAIANAIYKCYSKEEIALLSAILVQIGDTLTTKLAFDNACKDKNF